VFACPATNHQYFHLLRAFLLLLGVVFHNCTSEVLSAHLHGRTRLSREGGSLQKGTEVSRELSPNVEELTVGQRAFFLVETPEYHDFVRCNHDEPVVDAFLLHFGVVVVCLVFVPVFAHNLDRIGNLLVENVRLL